MEGPPSKRDGEDHIDYARRLVDTGHEDETIRFQMSITAATIAEMADRVPAGSSVQEAVELHIGMAHARQQPFERLQGLSDEFEAATASLEAIEERVDELARGNRNCDEPVVEEVDPEKLNDD